MRAMQFNQMLQFINTQPLLYFRDAEGGRIKVLNRAGDYLATLVPPGLFSDEAHLLFRNEAEDEFRGSWGFLAMILSAYQQSGADFNEVYEMEEKFFELLDAAE
jgi:hypothetical protein